MSSPATQPAVVVAPAAASPVLTGAPALSIAVMCYNEAGSLPEMIRRTVVVLRKLGCPFEIVIIEDGSTDGSAQAADAAAAEFPEVRVVHHPKNLGIGQVLIDGYGQTHGAVVGILPADLQFAPEDLPAALTALENADVVNITRDRSKDHTFRQLVSLVDRTLVWLLFGLNVQDIHWVKLYRREILSRINIVSRTPLVDTECLIKAKRLGARIVELPLPHHPRTQGYSKGATPLLLLKTFCDLLALRFKL